MSDVDVATIQVVGAIGVTFIGSYVAYKLTERGATRALRQEVVLRPYVDRATALRTVYLAMMDCAYKLNRSANRIPQTRQEYLDGVEQPLEYYKETINRNGIWLSKVEPKILDVLGAFNRTVLAIQAQAPQAATTLPQQSQSLQSSVEVPWDDFVRMPSAASKAIANELKIDVLEAELENLISKLRTGNPPVLGTPGIPSLSDNKDVDLLKVNLAADYRLGWLVAMITVYFALIVGLLVAWYQKYGSNPDVYYYLGISLISGVLASLLATQELLPYKNWLKGVDGWLRMIENNQRIPDVTELVRQRDHLKSSGHAMLIFLFLLDFYLTLLGNSSVQLFVGFAVVGAIIVFLTQGGIDLIMKRAKVPTTVA